MRNSNSITYWVSLSTSSSTRDFKPEFIKKDSRPNLSIRQESWSTRDTSELARILSMPTNSSLELPQKKRSTLPLSHLSKPKRPVEHPARKTKEKNLPKSDLHTHINHSSYHTPTLPYISFDRPPISKLISFNFFCSSLRMLPCSYRYSNYLFCFSF